MLPLAKSIKRYFSLKDITVVLLAVVISVSAGVGIFLSLKKEVAINLDGKQISIKTMKTTVREVLDQSGIKVEPEDYINVALNSKLHKISDNKIVIKKAVPVKVLVDGKEVVLKTYKTTVADALKNSPIELAETDRLDGVNFEDRIEKDMTIKVVRVKEEVVSEKIPIPFNVVKQANKRMDKGVERIVRDGKEGVREKTYKIVYEDGNPMTKSLLSDSAILKPITKIIEFGTVANFKSSRGDTVRYTKVLDMRATAYTASYRDTGKSPGHPQFGITYTGKRVKKGIIAVDPRVIPLHTRVYIEGIGSTPDYGFAVAEDIGGAIKGNKIDLYYDSQSVVDRWGVKKVKVYILAD